MNKFKGGAGSGGSRPGAGRPRSVGGSSDPVGQPVPFRKPLSGPSRPIGVRPSVILPHGRNPDGTPRTSNDIRDPRKPNKPKR